MSRIYDEFRRDFFPGEEVTALNENNEQVDGIIREKAKFPMIRGPTGDVQRQAFSRYFVRPHDQEKEYLMDDKHLRRPKKVFTKANIRSFLKHSLQREAWIGAPWLVKEHLAIQYRLPMEIPAHLLQDAKLLANKVRTYTLLLEQSFGSLANTSQQQMLQMKGPRSRPKKSMTQAEFNKHQQEELRMQQMQQVSRPDIPCQLHALTSKQHAGAPSHHLQQMQPIASRIDPRPPPPPSVKYPTEDLDIAPKRNGVKRPALEFFTPEMANYIEIDRKVTLRDIEMDSMGMLLEVWNTLNVQCEVYVLDSFTFDDFVDAMRYQSVDSTCELLEEMHCAVLKLLVDNKGKLTLTKHALPEMVVETDEEDESDEPQDESEVSTPLPDVPARSTRSRLSQVESAEDNAKSPTGPAERVHRVPEMLGGRDWVSRLAERDFVDGGWQVILAGVLHQLSLSSSFKARCNKVLAFLAPLAEPATQETARVQYANMNVNLRISALQMITMLSIDSPSIKDFLEACSDDMTDVRKKKMEHQKSRKAAMEELHIKDRERKILLPDNMPPSPKEESLEPLSVNGDADADDSVEVNGAGSSDPDDEAPRVGRSLRRGNDRKRKREEEAARQAEEKAKKAEVAKQQPKQSKEFKRLLTDIEELNKQIKSDEEKIEECDADLREANVQRTKVLGKDRFCNRYWWFERNGQPFGGLPRSSTASYGYANGRIWVQGPDDMERMPLIDRNERDQAEYRRLFGLTVPERRVQEEGPFYLKSANEWGYYDDPVLLDNLIAWLDERGDREKALRKELLIWRNVIVQYMEAHKKFNDEEAAKKIEADEEQATRISTRNKTHEDQTAAKERCLKWTNSMATEEIGHLHSQPGSKKTKKPPRGVAMPVNRYGKPVTRQGDKYDFK